MRIYIEYGCPKGEWGCSSPAKTRDGFWYRGQIQLHIDLPDFDCIREMRRSKVCDDCPVKGMVKAGSVTLWDTKESWEPLGGYNSQEAESRAGIR